MNGLIAAFDPGRNIGFALVDGHGKLVRAAVLADADLDTLQLPEGCTVVIGDGTGSAHLVEHLERLGVKGTLFNEAFTTLDARQLYYRHNPPRGLVRLIPAGLRMPPGSLDEYAAYALALRFLAAQGGTAGK